MRFSLAAAPSSRRIAWAALILAVVGVLAYRAIRQPQYDPDFDTRVADPAYRTNRPVVLYDEFHRNVHSADGGYRPFVDLLRSVISSASSSASRRLSSKSSRTWFCRPSNRISRR